LQIACFIAYAAQVYIGVALLKALFSLDGAPWYEFREQVQCGVLGALFILLGVVNFFEVVAVLVEKWSAKRKRELAKAVAAPSANNVSSANPALAGGLKKD
jgi:hypothetical protein